MRPLLRLVGPSLHHVRQSAEAYAMVEAMFRNWQHLGLLQHILRGVFLLLYKGSRRVQRGVGIDFGPLRRSELCVD